MMNERSLDWLPSCHGFWVEAADSRVGVVEDILYGAERGVPAALLVRGGFFGTRLTLVPAEEVLEVSPRSKRVLVSEGMAGAPHANR